MKIEELINIHQQSFSTPSRIKDLKQYEIEELLIFSNQLKSAIKKKILEEDTSDLSNYTDEKIQEYFDRHPLYERETVLQNFLTNALHSINTEGSLRLPNSIDIYEFNVPDINFYEQIIQSHYFEQKRKNQKNIKSDFIYALLESNKVPKDATGGTSTQDSETLNFLRAVLNGKLSAELDIYNKAQTLTDNFEEPKLSLLWNEYLKLLNDSVSRNTYKSFEEWVPEDSFENLYKKLGLNIQKHLMKTLQPEKKIIQPIHWLKGEKSQRQLIESLKNAGLIENRATDDIIKEHFKKTDKIPQPIQWSRSNRLLIYLFTKLSENELVDTVDRQFQLITEHFLDKKGKPFKSDSLKQDFQNMKYSSDPRGAKTIDSIIIELTD